MKYVLTTLGLAFFTACFAQSDSAACHHCRNSKGVYFPSGPMRSRISAPITNAADIFGRSGELVADVLLNRDEITLRIINRTDSSYTYMQEDFFFPIVREAMDSTGKWVPIEYWEWSTCGNSYFPATLEPGTMLTMSTILYGGTMKTKIRFVIVFQGMIFYSEPYKGRVDPKQFIYADSRQIDVNQLFNDFKSDPRFKQDSE